MAERPVARRLQTNTEVTPINPQVSQVADYRAVEPPTPDTTGSKLARALQIGAYAVNGSTQFIGTKAQKDYEEGQRAAIAGQKPSFDMDLFNQKMEGYYKTQGILDANKNYKAEVNKFLLTEAPGLNLEEFEQRMNAISEKYIMEQPQPYVDAFLETALSIEDQAYSNYQGMLSQQLQQKNISLMNQYVATAVESSILDVAGKALDGNFASLQDFGENKSTLDKFGYINDDLIVEALRETISEAQERGAELGLTKNQVSELAIDSIGQIAVTYGLPELLGVGEIKDEDGVKLKYTAVGPKIDKYKAQAIESKQQIAELTEMQAQAEREATIEAFTKQQYVRLNDLYAIADPVQRAVEARKVMADLRASDIFYSMDTSDINSITKALNKEIQGGAQYGESDPVVYGELKTTIRTNPSAVTQASLVDALNSGRINASDYRELIDLKTRVEQDAATEMLTTQQQQIKSATTDARDSVINFLSTQLVGVGALKAKDKAAIEMEILEREDEFYSNYGYKGYKYDDYITEVINPVLASHGVSMEDVLSYQNEFTDIGDRGFSDYISNINTSYVSEQEAAQVYQELGIFDKVFDKQSKQEAIRSIQQDMNKGVTSFSEPQAIAFYDGFVSTLPLIETTGGVIRPPVDDPDGIAKALNYGSFEEYKQSNEIQGNTTGKIKLLREYYKSNNMDLQAIRSYLLDRGHSMEDIHDYELLYGVNKAVKALMYDSTLDSKLRVYTDLRAFGYSEDVVTKMIGIGLKTLTDPQGQFAQMFK